MMYCGCIGIIPENANVNGNYVKYLISVGRFEKAKLQLTQVFQFNKNRRNDLCLELWFYSYAVFHEDYPNAENMIEGLLNNGIHSKGWYLDDVIKKAEKRGHPNIEKLKELAKRITE